jgi:hypothetical protein
MLQNSFGTKSIEDCFKAVMHFMHKHKYVYCQKINEATRAPQEVYDKAKEFMELTRLLLLGPNCNWCWIFIMDQMPLHYLYHSSKTYAKCGSKTIHMCKSSNGTKRAMGVLTKTITGHFLTPMIISKGKPNGEIASYELKNFDPTSVYACQDAK